MPSPVYESLILLTSRADRQPNFLNKVYNPTACTAAGFGLAMILNWGLRKPMLSVIQTPLAMAAVGIFAGVYIDKVTRDAFLRHYVELNPEDFTVVERKKYGDVLEKWVPIC